MTARDPLFEFMPYGAPELLDARRPHLLRALALASVLALAAFGLAQTLRGGEFVEPVIEMPRITIVDPPPPLPNVKTIPTETHRVAPSAPREAMPVPVPDVLAPPSTPVSLTPGFDVGAPPGEASPPMKGVAGVGEPDNTKYPEIGEYVYTDVMPVAVKLVKPVYPEFAHETNSEGRVVCLMLVGKDGRVVRAEIDPRNSNPMFDQAVLAAARQWVFTPAYTNDNPVPVWVTETFTFRIR